MCRICRRYYCLPFCPSYQGKSPEWGARPIFCRVCGVWIDEAVAYGEAERGVFCPACVGKREQKKNREEEI